MSLQKVSANKVNDGQLIKYSFTSSVLGDLSANLNVFLPPQAVAGAKVPVLYFLSGLTCTEDNAAQKGGFFATAAQEGIAIVFPDTSPRGAKIEGEEESYDFGTGAGFYINATKEPWKKHYKMYDHVVREIPEQIKMSGLPIDTKKASIFGHSMGGHGALTIYLREAGLYRSCSAFAPICHPSACPWGQKAFSGYFASASEGLAHDATELISKCKPEERKLDILIDSGLADNFYEQGQLLPEDFAKKAMENGYDDKQITLRLQEGYDHSYYTISTFAPEHIKFHAKFLKA